jgi:outer membrane protein assembly factor BamB
VKIAPIAGDRNIGGLLLRIAQNAGRTQREHKWVIAPVVLIFALLLAGCGRQVPAYWPDLSAEGLASQDGTVYVAQLNGQVFALRADTGAIQWTYPQVEERSGGLLRGCSGPVATDGPFHSAPAFDEGYIYLGSAGERQQRSLFGGGTNNSGLRTLNELGTLQWEFRGTTDRTVASPTVAGSTIYLSSSDHSVYAIDTETRQARWTFETENWVWATPLVTGDRVYIASMDHHLYAINDADGSLAWEFTGEPGALPATPAIHQGILYFGSLSGHVYAVQAQNGTVLWTKKVDGGIWATPLALDREGTLALYFGTLDGTIYSLDSADGSELWKRDVPDEVRGSAAHVDGILYFGCADGKLYAFDAQTGQETVSPLGQQIENASIYASPVYDGQQLYVVATNGEVFSLDPERNAIVWQVNPLDQDREEE